MSGILNDRASWFFYVMKTVAYDPEIKSECMYAMTMLLLFQMKFLVDVHMYTPSPTQIQP